MSKVIVDMGMSLDEFIAGTNSGPHNALGDGGHRGRLSALRAHSGPRPTCGATALSCILTGSTGRRWLIAKTTGC